MRTTVDLDAETERELARTVSLTREKQAVVLRQAIRAGLPSVQNRYAAPRPLGYFADAYEPPDPARTEFERKMAQAVRQRPER